MTTRLAVISLTELPHQVFLVPCERNDTRYLAIRNDDPDEAEAVLFVADTAVGATATVESMVDTAVVLCRESVAALAHVLLDTALGMVPSDDTDGPDADPNLNGHGG